MSSGSRSASSIPAVTRLAGYLPQILEVSEQTVRQRRGPAITRRSGSTCCIRGSCLRSMPWRVIDPAPQDALSVRRARRALPARPSHRTASAPADEIYVGGQVALACRRPRWSGTGRRRGARRAIVFDRMRQACWTRDGAGLDDRGQAQSFPRRRETAQPDMADTFHRIVAQVWQDMAPDAHGPR